MLAERQIRFDPVFDRPAAQLLQPDDLRLSKRLASEIRERRPTPERERLAQLRGGAARLPRGERALAIIRQVLESDQVNLLWRGPEDVATWLGEHARAACRRVKRSAQPPNVDVHGMAGPGRRMLAPELLDEHIASNWLVRVQKQDRQQSPLLQAANIQGVPIEGNFERPEKAIVDHVPPPRAQSSTLEAPKDSAGGTALTSNVSFL